MTPEHSGTGQRQPRKAVTPRASTTPPKRSTSGLRKSIEDLVADESRHMVRWIDGSHLVDLEDLQKILADHE